MPSLMVDSVPESHSWSEIHDHHSVDLTVHDKIPVIDLTGPDAAQLVGLACESWGIFQVIGHGIPEHLLRELDFQVKRLFALPEEEKIKAARGAGREGYGSPLFSAIFPKELWLEGFTIIGSPHNIISKIWPDDPTFSNVVEKYIKELNSLSKNVLQLMLLSLGFTKSDIEKDDPIGLNQKEQPRAFRLNWYPACPEPDRAMGMGRHTDAAMITLLYQGDTSGLQVLRVKDQNGPSRWVTVPILPGALVVSVGDFGHILSNGRFLNVEHRVVVNSARPRLSAAYFWSPPDDVTVSPILGSQGSRPVYRGVTWPQYMDTMRKVYDKALDSIKVAVEEKDSCVAGSVKQQTK